MKQTYRIWWDNGHASGTLAETFTSKRAAKSAARAWKRSMIDIDDDPREARTAYQWEIVSTEVTA